MPFVKFEVPNAGTLVPDTLAGYINQQRRWCKTSMFSDAEVAFQPLKFLLRFGRPGWGILQQVQLCASMLDYYVGIGWGLGESLHALFVGWSVS